MSKYILGAGAVADLEEIWEFIAQDNPEAANRWVEKLFDTFEEFGRVPGMGHRREDLTSFPVLFFPVGAYLVIYRIAPKQVEIVGVTQGARDMPSFLCRREPT
jgi:plasmid stabilization system protein ParE